MGPNTRITVVFAGMAAFIAWAVHPPAAIGFMGGLFWFFVENSQASDLEIQSLPRWHWRRFLALVVFFGTIIGGFVVARQIATDYAQFKEGLFWIMPSLFFCAGIKWAIVNPLLDQPPPQHRQPPR